MINSGDGKYDQPAKQGHGDEPEMPVKRPPSKGYRGRNQNETDDNKNKKYTAR